MIDSDVCTRALHVTQTDIGLWPGNSQTSNKHNINNAVILYLRFYIIYNFYIFEYPNTWHCVNPDCRAV
jgi:hypothetical protein